MWLLSEIFHVTKTGAQNASEKHVAKIPLAWQFLFLEKEKNAESLLSSHGFFCLFLFFYFRLISAIWRHTQPKLPPKVTRMTLKCENPPIPWNNHHILNTCAVNRNGVKYNSERRVTIHIFYHVSRIVTWKKAAIPKMIYPALCFTFHLHVQWFRYNPSDHFVSNWVYVFYSNGPE